jgi:hypothetical protein
MLPPKRLLLIFFWNKTKLDMFRCMACELKCCLLFIIRPETLLTRIRKHQGVSAECPEICLLKWSLDAEVIAKFRRKTWSDQCLPSAQRCRPMQLTAPVSRGGSHSSESGFDLGGYRRVFVRSLGALCHRGFFDHALWQTCVGIDRFGLSCRDLAFTQVEEGGSLQPLR